MNYIINRYLKKIDFFVENVVKWVDNNILTFVCMLIILNLGIKSYNIYENSLHIDETFRMYWGSQSYKTIYFMSKNETNPPFYLWILHTWYKLGGRTDSEVYFRYLSVIFSVFSSVLLFYFGRSYVNTLTGVISALLFSVNPVQVSYAHNISAYTMITFLFILSLHLTHLYFKYHHHLFKRRFIFFGLIITNTVLIYTHYFIVFGLVAQFLMAVFKYKENKKAFFEYCLN